MLLDLLGVSKETRKKVKLRNMQTDCMHSFFGGYCDCFVSDDAGILKKSKTLYKLFNIETQIYSIDEFIKVFDEAIKNNQKSASEYKDRNDSSIYLDTFGRISHIFWIFQLYVGTNVKR